MLLECRVITFLSTLYFCSQETGQLDPDLCVTLAEAAAKSAEHVALLQVLKPDAATDSSDVEEEEERDTRWQLWAFRAGDTPWFVPLSEARARTGEGRRLHAPCGQPFTFVVVLSGNKYAASILGPYQSYQKDPTSVPLLKYAHVTHIDCTRLANRKQNQHIPCTGHEKWRTYPARWQHSTGHACSVKSHCCASHVCSMCLPCFQTLHMACPWPVCMS